MIKIAICDEDEVYLQLIEEAVKKYLVNGNVQYYIKKYNLGETLLNEKSVIEECDIVFLDVNMRDIDGIKAAKNIRELNKNVYIVFITSDICYSTEGYKVNAIRYILKDNIESMLLDINEALETITNRMHIIVKSKKLKLKVENIEREVSIGSVMYAESNLHKLTIYVNAGESYSMYNTLDNFEKEVDDSDFCRVHKSVLINMNYIKTYNKDEIIMDNGFSVHIPRAKIKDVKATYILHRGKKLQ